MMDKLVDILIENEWTRTELWNAVDILPKKQRELIMMRIAQELSYKDISEITGMSEGTARVNFHHAVTKLKILLKDD